MKKAVLALSFLFALLVLIPPAGGTGVVHVITPQSFLEHIDFLADPRLEGRKPDTPGCRRAGRYIASKLKLYGTMPAGDNGTWFQHFSYKVGQAEVKTRNVIGILEGADKKLKNEAIVVMAHYDHLGKGRGFAGSGRRRGRGRERREGGQSSVFPGANDNASGTAGLLEIARAIKEKKLTPKRTIIFIAVSSEEAGLKGSGHYVEHPIFPLEKTAMVINLDMLGGYADGVYAMNVGSSPRINEALDAVFANSPLVIRRSENVGPSDHVMFNCNFVPSVFFCTGMDENLHTPNDTADRINKEDGAVLVRAILKLACWFADAEKIESAMKHPRGYAMAYIGLEAHSRQGRFIVNGMPPESPAAKAGIKQDDLLISVDGKRVSSNRDIQNIISGHKAGDKVEVEIIRDGKTHIYEVELDRRRPYSRQQRRRRAA
ncbi:MAG: M20/M25/M40 family metallo-hydrolase [Planctomycetota bacterium]|jgi:hypothetical protein